MEERRNKKDIWRSYGKHLHNQELKSRMGDIKERVAEALSLEREKDKLFHLLRFLLFNKLVLLTLVIRWEINSTAVAVRRQQVGLTSISTTDKFSDSGNGMSTMSSPPRRSSRGRGRRIRNLTPTAMVTGGFDITIWRLAQGGECGRRQR